jgi:hypothetical protein
MESPARRHRVLVVREWDQQVGGSGCCGRLGTSVTGEIRPGEESPFARNREGMERAGAVYRALDTALAGDDVELVVVDPRNTAWLLPAVWRDGRRRGLGVPEALRQVNRATGACVVVVDGLVVAADPTPRAAVDAVRADLDARRAPA